MDSAFSKLIEYIEMIPAVHGEIRKGVDDGSWWVKFEIDIHHRYFWRTVQVLGHALNSLSLDQRPPTVFQPVSSSPKLKYGPEEIVSWIIECTDLSFRPGDCAVWLEELLPRPVENLGQWDDQ